MPNIFRSTMVRNAGKLLSANVIAQAIGILVYPVLTRMYAPEDFALLSLFTSIAGVLTLIATAEYQYAIVLPKAEEHARALTHICLLLLAAMTLLACLSLPFAQPIAALFKAPELARWWWMMPLSVFGLGLWNILNYWYIRRRAFTRISGYQITQSVFSASGKIGLGWLGWLQGGMIIATVFAPLLSLLVNGALAWRKYLSELLHPNREDMRAMAREYANFPKFNLPRALVNSVGIALPVWLLTPHFGLSEVGQLSLAMMAAFAPLSIISRACYQVLYQRVAERVQLRQPVSPVLRRFCLWMAAALVVGLTPVFIFVPQLVTFIFGAEWLESAYIIRVLYPFIVLTPICGSICFLSDVFAKQQTALWMEVGYVVVLALALVVGIYTGDFLSAIAFFAWVRFAYLAIQLVWYIFLVRNYNRTLS
ncbi:MAG: lipopolysaccharide biosynthesis protein [Paludibacteraceae bacterium]|nr:lipopolysaccharide biosynthesis protein [Paludibacteraceae bacterium]